MEWIMRINDFVGDLVWGPFMLAVLVGVGIYYTVRTGLFQLTYINKIFKNTLGKLFSKSERSQNGVTPFQAVSTALAGTMGVGNIAGVGTALAAGGPGALFWMWVSAFFGMMTKYAEVVLSMVYQTTDEKGNKMCIRDRPWYCGPQLSVYTACSANSPSIPRSCFFSHMSNHSRIFFSLSSTVLPLLFLCPAQTAARKARRPARGLCFF